MAKFLFFNNITVLLFPILLHDCFQFYCILVSIRPAALLSIFTAKDLSDYTDYMEGVNWLRSMGFGIYGAVIDGIKGLTKALYPIPVQLCQFHQMLIVRRYITQDPDIEASKALLDLVNDITKMDKESFIGAFKEWYEKYQDVLNERVHDKRIKKKTPPFMRPKLHSAYFSVKRNMPLLWAFYDRPELGLPNTNNALERLFSELKTKVRVHSGISRENRKKLLDETHEKTLLTRGHRRRNIRSPMAKDRALRGAPENALLAPDCCPYNPTFCPHDPKLVSDRSYPEKMILSS